MCNFKFTCELCKKEVKRGPKFRVEADVCESDTQLTGELEADGLCQF